MARAEPASGARRTPEKPGHMLMSWKEASLLINLIKKIIGFPKLLKIDCFILK